MRNFFHAFLAASLSLTLVGGQEEEPRSFTNRDGKVIEAVLLDVTGQNARIRRVADGRDYEIQVGSLSLDDQIWIVDWIRQRSRPAAGEWADLRVVLPNPMDFCGVVGLPPGSLREKVGASEFDLLLPEGAWVKVSVYSAGNVPQPIEHLVPFQGEKRWEFSAEGPTLLLSRDGGPAKIVGISVVQTVNADWLDELDEKQLADRISVEVAPAVDFRRLGWRKTEIVACSSKYSVDAAFLSKIAEAAPQAVDLTVTSDAIGRLADFPELEALSLRVSLRNREEDGTRTRESPDDLVFDSLPAVRDLSLSGIPFSRELGAMLCETGKLRLFYFAVGSASTTSRDPAPWEGLARLSDSLESLNLARGIRIDPAELAPLSRLKALALGADAMDPARIGAFDPAAWPDLLCLQLDVSAAGAELWTEWARGGALEKLRRLDAFQVFDVSKIPDLEMARFWATGSSARDIDLGRLRNAGKIRKLSLSGAQQKDIADLAGLPGRDRIEALRLDSGSFTDLSPLSEMPRLESLELFGNADCPPSIDLGMFPRLTAFSAYSQQKLESIDGVAAHPALRSLIVSGCDALRDLGASAPNNVLSHVYLFRCPALENLSALDQMTGLTQMRLYNCDLLAGPLRFVENNSWNYLRISGCENLPNLSASSLDQ